MYIAHINEKSNEVQTVKEHSLNTAILCRNFAIPELKDLMYMMGLLHDVGKYQPSFQERLKNKKVHVEHSICGALVAKERYSGPVRLIMEYCIAGHHSGIPNAGYVNDTRDMSTLCGRLKRETEDYQMYQSELNILNIDAMSFANYLMRDCNSDNNMIIDKFAFFTRYCFSCLTDADSLDTAKFCDTISNRSLKSDFKKCLSKINHKLLSFTCTTELQKARTRIQKQVFDKLDASSEIYLLNMPTGSGKTLCSMKFALERAVRCKKDRIIYVIPYNSIIDQTFETFEEIFAEDAEILRHQSTFSFEDSEKYDEDYQDVVKKATENWDAQIIVTTAVQFFESIYANKRGKLRKLHNMRNSILVFDEAHLMPCDYMQPCLQAISYITKYLESEAILLTATMPAYSKLIKQYALDTSQVTDLIHNKAEFKLFEKCRYDNLGELSEERIVEMAKQYPTTLIIVNKRSTARKLFRLCTGKKYHLSTYMTSYDRIKVINSIRYDLNSLEHEYPNLIDVPDDRKVTVISTSLIEAGVDLDFFTVLRELSGLDNILQAGGRCNREGKRTSAMVGIFTLESERSKISIDERINITKGLIAEYKDISSQECINSYYDRLFFVRNDNISERTMHMSAKRIDSIPFKKYSDDFEFINSNTISIIVARDQYSQKLIDMIQYSGETSVRKLQQYACSIYQYEFDDLYKQHVISDYGTGVWCLTNLDYYDEKIGITFEGQDYFL